MPSTNNNNASAQFSKNDLKTENNAPKEVDQPQDECVGISICCSIA